MAPQGGRRGARADPGQGRPPRRPVAALHARPRRRRVRASGPRRLGGGPRLAERRAHGRAERDEGGPGSRQLVAGARARALRSDLHQGRQRGRLRGGPVSGRLAQGAAPGGRRAPAGAPRDELSRCDASRCVPGARAMRHARGPRRAVAGPGRSVDGGDGPSPGRDGALGCSAADARERAGSRGHGGRLRAVGGVRHGRARAACARWATWLRARPSSSPGWPTRSGRR